MIYLSFFYLCLDLVLDKYFLERVRHCEGHHEQASQKVEDRPQGNGHRQGRKRLLKQGQEDKRPEETCDDRNERREHREHVVECSTPHKHAVEHKVSKSKLHTSPFYF